MTFNPEMWVALSSVVVAVCALVVTIWQGRQNYKHNKMSVRPLLTTMEKYQDRMNNRIVNFELINSGFGPAIIKDFILVYNNEEVSKNNRKTYEDFMMKKASRFELLNLISFAPNSSIQSDERVELFAMRYNPKTDDASFLEKLNIKINYQSIYGDETFTYDSRKDRLHHGLESTA